MKRASVTNEQVVEARLTALERQLIEMQKSWKDTELKYKHIIKELHRLRNK